VPEVHPTGSALGADITGVDLSRPLTSSEFGAIHAAWMRHLVLRFREQHLTDDALMAFSRNFGALDGNPRHAKAEGRANNAAAGFVNIISNVVEDGHAIGGLGNYESKWHTDMSYNPVPPMASALYALEVPDSGGDTGFCNMYSALETLPTELRARIKDLSCVHDSSLNSVGQLRVGFEDVTDARRGTSVGANASGYRPRVPVPRPPPERVRTGPGAGRQRGAAGYAVGACHTTPALLDTAMAGWRPGAVG
jgi:taurine dioxygenase